MFNPQPKPTPKPKKKRKRIKAVSVKRDYENRMYTVARKEHLAEFPACVVCGHAATTVHHAKGRIGPLIHDKRYFKSACMPCHEKIEDNPVWAKKMGYSINRL